MLVGEGVFRRSLWMELGGMDENFSHLLLGEY